MTTNFPSSVDAFTNPTSADTLDNPPHDQQHADINDAMEAVQTKVGVDGSTVTSSLDYKVAQQGLTFIKSQTIGSGVSSVTVTGAFSATFDNYRIVINGLQGVSAGHMLMTFVGSTTGYYGLTRYWVYNGTAGYVGRTNGADMPLFAIPTPAPYGTATFDVCNPYNTTSSAVHGTYVGGDTNGFFGFFHTDTGSYTNFTLATTSNTFSQGTIRVYGYNDG